MEPQTNTQKKNNVPKKATEIRIAIPSYWRRNGSTYFYKVFSDEYNGVLAVCDSIKSPAITMVTVGQVVGCDCAPITASEFEAKYDKVKKFIDEKSKL